LGTQLKGIGNRGGALGGLSSFSESGTLKDL
jgi:hypothetical protein